MSMLSKLSLSALAALLSVISQRTYANPIKPFVGIRTFETTIPIRKEINTDGRQNFLDADRSRVNYLLQGTADNADTADADSYEVNVTNSLAYYTASVGIGSPPTNCK